MTQFLGSVKITNKIQAEVNGGWGKERRCLEFGSRNAEKKKAEGGRIEVGSRTRRRPIRQDYAAAKDAASGLSEL
jgi:hypothetical protein